jgi:hypothetical protein
MRENVRREKRRKKREESDVVIMFKEMKKRCYVVL